MLYLLFISGLMWLIILAYEGSYSIWASAGVMQPIVDILMAMLCLIPGASAKPVDSRVNRKGTKIWIKFYSLKTT